MRAADPRVSASTMSKKLGCSRERVRQVLVALGLPTTVRDVYEPYCPVCRHLRDQCTCALVEVKVEVHGEGTVLPRTNTGRVYLTQPDTIAEKMVANTAVIADRIARMNARDAEQSDETATSPSEG